MIELQPMSPAEFKVYLERSVAEYADDKVRAGNWPQAGALERSRQEFNKYLPQGLDTPENFLCTLIDRETGAPVGMIWYAPLPGSPDPAWFIYDFYIEAGQRRRGYAAQALAALEGHARVQGIKAIALHVFGHNTAARALYEKMGYEITNINMVRKWRRANLTRPPPSAETRCRCSVPSNWSRPRPSARTPGRPG